MEPFEQAIGIPEFLPELLFSNPNATCTTIDLNDSECQSAFEPEPEPEEEPALNLSRQNQSGTCLGT